MEDGHSFHKMHGFTGSASSKDMRPTIPGYARGGHVHVKQVKEATIPMASGEPDGDEAPMAMKHGGRVKHGHHPKHPHHGHTDKHGFHIHNSKHHKE